MPGGGEKKGEVMKGGKLSYEERKGGKEEGVEVQWKEGEATNKAEIKEGVKVKEEEPQ